MGFGVGINIRPYFCANRYTIGLSPHGKPLGLLVLGSLGACASLLHAPTLYLGVNRGLGLISRYRKPLSFGVESHSCMGLNGWGGLMLHTGARPLGPYVRC